MPSAMRGRSSVSGARVSNNRDGSGRERSDAGDGGDPQRRAARPGGCRDRSRRIRRRRARPYPPLRDGREDVFHVGWLRTRDQPDGEDGENEAADGPAAGRAFHGDIDQRGDGRAHQRRDGGRQAHLSRGQGAIKDGQRESSGGPCDQAQTMLRARGIRRDVRARWRTSAEGADVREGGEHEGVGAAGSVSAGKVGGAPQEDCGHTVGGGRELGQRGHAGRA